ncbi:TetR/AcrR family transcriptional regulator [Diaminobutyricibacter sp. McL0608]|uniref:TetR/AcrR family transcriptional regulator n=1 Tax=Leifsonia sp. McL0608 TaxID=3143537 RepID=UPI0031F312DC
MSERAPRADAVRNRTRILDEARTAFEREGVDVPLDSIAAAAGVGAGTVHRHFPTKDALVSAVIETRLTEMADRVRVASGASDPGSEFFVLLVELVESAGGNLALTEALAGERPGPAVATAGARLSSELQVLLTRAQDVRAVRGDIDVPSLHALLSGAIHMRRLPGVKPELVLDVIERGLAPGPGTDAEGE